VEDESAPAIDPARLYAAAQIAYQTGVKPATVRRRIWEADVPRCDWQGWETSGGPAVLGADYLARSIEEYATNHQRRNMLRRAGEIAT
jgi:hypothetical protein